MAVTLDELYDYYDKLSAAKDVTELKVEYVQCIAGTKGDEREKKLAAQIISKFFRHFPSIQDQALNAVLDLCEDDDSMIRISAMKVLPLLCKDSKDIIYKVSDILAQLLQLEDQDYNVCCNSLIQVFRQDSITVTKAIFAHIHSCNDEVARERAITFLFKKLTKIMDKLTTELEDLLIEEGKKTIRESTATEFTMVIPFLISSKLGKTIVGQQEIVNLVAERAELDKEFSVEEENSLDRILMCLEPLLPLFNANVESTKFVTYFCDQILPQLSSVEKMENGEKYKNQVFIQLADLSTHCGKLETPTVYVEQIFKKMKEYMPPPPEDVDIAAELPNLDFTAVECLLYAFHRLARQCPDFLTSDPAVLKDFKSRLTYFSRAVQGCKKSLSANKSALSKEDSKKMILAPKVLDNINSLIKDLFYQPPVYKCLVQLSFKSEEAKIKVTAERPAVVSDPNKRHIPITFDSSNGNVKQPRTNKPGENVKLYTPPSGKFSNNFQSYDRSGTRGRGNRGMRGGSRGRGRGTWRK